MRRRKKKDDAFSKLADEKRKFRVICKCGWYNYIYPPQNGRKICINCGNWVYETPQIEFEYKMKELMNKCKSLNCKKEEK